MTAGKTRGRSLLRNFCLNAMILASVLSVGVSLLPGEASRAQAADTPEVFGTRAEELLKRRCGNEGCHGASGKNEFHVFDRAEYIGGVVKPRDLAGSSLVKRIASGSMPPDGSPKLTAAEIALVERWVKEGAPAGGSSEPSPVRPFIAEGQVLQAILQDLNAAPDDDQPYLRYFSLTNVSNNPRVNARDLELFRTSLSKLVNHLSQKPRIVRPHAVDVQRLVYRVDIRHYGWDEHQWDQVISAYPYGVKPRNAAGTARAIQAASGARFPYIRVDWFIANASVPPLYFALLRLPETVKQLEANLGVDPDQDLRQGTLRRFGLSNSGVSVNNRGMDRHDSVFGAYWRSFDFLDSDPERGHNIHADPLNFHPDGGEYVFHLPNGLQGYFISDVDGKRLDSAPERVVANKADPLGPTVVTGRSCMGCHYKGVVPFQDELGMSLAFAERQWLRNFDQRKAEQIYLGPNALTKLIDEDNRRFARALLETGAAMPEDAGDEPISKLAQRFGGTVSIEQATADAQFEDVEEFRAAIRTNQLLLQKGLLSLAGPGGTIKRDAWQRLFPDVVEELRLGDYLAPTPLPIQATGAPDAGFPRVVIGELAARDVVDAERARTLLVYFLNQSKRVRIVKSDGTHSLKGRLVPASGDAVTVSIGDPKLGVMEESTGSASDLASILEQLANKIHFKLTGHWLPPAQHQDGPGSPEAIGVSGNVTKLLKAVGNGNGVTLSLGLDRGPGATYKSGETVEILFRVDRDAFVTLYNIDSTQHTETLFPNSATTRNWIRAGEILSFKARVKPDGQFGAEQVVAVATIVDGNLPGVKRLADGSKGLTAVDGDPHEVLQEVRQAIQAISGQGGAASAAVRFFTIK